MKSGVLSAVGAAIAMLLLIIDSQTAAAGAAEGIQLCMQALIPSLFPFLFLSQILSNGLKDGRFSILDHAARIFRIPKSFSGLLIPAFLGGYPVGAQAIGQASKSRKISKQDAQILLGFCSNPGPSFLFGVLGKKFASPIALWCSWGILIASAILTAHLLPPVTGSLSSQDKEPISFSEALSVSIKSMAQICGWVILFRIGIAFLQPWILRLFPQTVQVLLIGLLELTNGCCMLDQIPTESLRFILCTTLLAFGGGCVFLQVSSVVYGLSLHFFFLGTCLKTAIAFLLSCLFISLKPVFFFLLCGSMLIFMTAKQKRSSISTIGSV